MERIDDVNVTDDPAYGVASHDSRDSNMIHLARDV